MNYIISCNGRIVLDYDFNSKISFRNAIELNDSTITFRFPDILFCNESWSKSSLYLDPLNLNIKRIWEIMSSDSSLDEIKNSIRLSRAAYSILTNGFTESDKMDVVNEVILEYMIEGGFTRVELIGDSVKNSETTEIRFIDGNNTTAMMAYLPNGELKFKLLT